MDPISGNPYPNNQVPVNPIIATYIAKYVPLPNIPGTDLFASSPVEDQTENQGISRVDWQLSKKDLIYGTYIIDELSENIPILIENGASAGGTLPVGSGSASDYHNQFLTGHGSAPLVPTC